DLAKELSDLKKTVKNIEELETQIQQTKIEKDSALKNLVDYYISTKNKRAKFYESVDFGTDFSFLQIGIQTKYDLEDLKNFMVTNINTVSTLKRVQDNKDIKHLFSDSPKELTKETVKEFITKLITGEIKIKVGAGEISEVISRFLKNRYSIDYLNSVKTHDGKTTFENMTGGEKSIALLELIFKYDDEKYPILIDQPEDDLDVTGIATNLVNFVKKEKEQRQIILVTHNASLAICSDTENIVVAESSKLKDQLIDFEYKSGGIENTKMRNDIIRILEGGEKALTLRMMKLSIKL
ncbi:MAG: AAA family ATPase, partial [Patescibacteria group bacterium]